MFTDSHCHIEDDATAFRAGEAGVGVILNAGKDLDEAAAQLLMCERMDSLRAAQSAAGRGGPAGVAGELNGTGQTILMVTHSVKAASHAGRVLFLRDGQVYHQLYRGGESQEAQFRRISDTLTVLAGGGEPHA